MEADQRNVGYTKYTRNIQEYLVCNRRTNDVKIKSMQLFTVLLRNNSLKESPWSKHVWMICAISENFRIPIANFEANVPKGSEVTTCSESSSCFLFLMCILNFTVFVKEENSAGKIILIVIQFTLQVFLTRLRGT